MSTSATSINIINFIVIVSSILDFLSIILVLSLSLITTYNISLYLGYVVSYFYVLIINIIIMLVITLVIAALTLIERKFLALNQRRVGPYYVGYRGRLQYIADALKLFIKGVVIYDESNKFWFLMVPGFTGLVCYFFWVNSVWCPSVSIVEIEYNLVYATLLSVLFGFCIILLGYFSGNKYTKLAAIRCALSMLNLELFIGLMTLVTVCATESFCLSVFVLYQENVWFIFMFFGLSGLICIIFLMEVGRTPFDFAEAESELVVGYSTEIGGFTFGIFYLGEYFHLFFFSAVISIMFFGGWELPNFLFINTSMLRSMEMEYFYLNIAETALWQFVDYFILTILELTDIENFSDYGTYQNVVLISENPDVAEVFRPVHNYDSYIEYSIRERICRPNESLEHYFLRLQFQDWRDFILEFATNRTPFDLYYLLGYRENVRMHYSWEVFPLYRYYGYSFLDYVHIRLLYFFFKWDLIEI